MATITVRQDENLLEMKISHEHCRTHECGDCRSIRLWLYGVISVIFFLKKVKTHQGKQSDAAVSVERKSGNEGVDTSSVHIQANGHQG